MTVRLWRGDVASGIALEEADGLQREADHRHRHHRPVLGTRHVVVAERVPNHQIAVLHRSILGGPLRKPRAAWMLARILPGCITLVRLIRRNPQMVADEASAL